MREKGLYSLKYTSWRYRTELIGGSRSGHRPGAELLGDKMTSQHGMWLRISLFQLLSTPSIKYCSKIYITEKFNILSIWFSSIKVHL